jgi:hypothetical protein
MKLAIFGALRESFFVDEIINVQSYGLNTIGHVVEGYLI